jgi:hypothetical protein
MRKVATLILFLAFAAQTFSQGLTLLHFYINQKTIAARHCENRVRPGLHCNGKCILAKKMKQQEKKEQQTPGIKLQGKSQVNSSRSFFTLVLVTGPPTYPAYIVIPDAATIDRSFSIFHPPCG